MRNVSVVAPMTPGDLVSDEAFLVFQWAFYAVTLLIISTFGIVTNIINVICFVKMGLKDPVNVSLLGLAISDLGSLATLFGTSICFNPAVYEWSFSVDSMDLQYLALGWPHIVFVRVTSWMTALITLWRCLCITKPLKVKSIITPKRVTIIIVCVFLILISGVAPVYYANRLGMKFSPARNRTLLGLVPTSDRTLVDQITFTINNVFVPVSAFITVTICTVVLVRKLRQKAKWRLKCTMTINNSMDTVSDRDQKVARLVVMISTLFIVCFFPICFTFVGMIVMPGVTVDGEYKNTLFVLGGLSILLEAANSASNIFIYYHMSSRYRDMFQQICLRVQKQ